MTQSLEQAGPGSVDPDRGTSVAATPAEQSVRELLAELAHLEDALRDGSLLEEAEARAREQLIIAELHRRSPQDGV